MAHVKLEISANEYQQEELIAFLDDYAPTGFEQTDETLTAYFEKDGWAEADIMKAVEGYGCQLSEVQDQNWNAQWERSYQPVLVEGFCSIRAHFHQPTPFVEHDIVITPKMSFGTGHHATTYMMVQQMQAIDFINKTVFDFGTGTGILSILAQKMGAASITAIDIDEWSIANAKENFETNKVTNASLRLSHDIPRQIFDVVLANINRNVILDYQHLLKDSLKPDGLLLLSGLLVGDKDVVVSCFQSHHLQPEKLLEKDGWVSLLFSNGHESMLF